MKKRNIEYVKIRPKNNKRLTEKGMLPQEKLKEESVKLPFGVNETENFVNSI